MSTGSNARRPLVVVGIGELLWDLLPAGKQLGGAPANFAYHAKAIGAEGIVASCVGKDALGHEILDRLDELRVSRDYVAMHPSAATGTVEVRLDANGVPDFIIHQNVAWDLIPAAAGLMELAKRADAACFGSLAQRGEVSRQTIRQFVAATAGRCLRIFDINLRQSFFGAQVIHDSLSASDVLKLNDTELPVVVRLLELPESEPMAIRQLIRRYSLRVVALTCGGNGSRLYTADRVFEHPGYPTTVVDTVGAGDAFTAALAVGLLRGHDLTQINNRANRLASYVCSQSGATPAIHEGLLRVR